MSIRKQETIADIVKEMRTLGRLDEKSTDKIPRTLQALGLRTYADRIEAAAKREREAGAEAAQVCGEIGEMIGREATREKSSRVGNAAKMREALGEISREIWESIDPFCNDDCCKPKRELAKIADAAIASPPRNCDRPECATTKAAQDVWNKEDGGKTAYYEWLLATYTEGGTTDGKKH